VVSPGGHALAESAYEPSWVRQVATDLSDSVEAVAVGMDGHVYITGLTAGGLDGSNNVGGSDIYVSKYDTSGQRHWTRQAGTSSNDFGNALDTDAFGNIYVGGDTRGHFNGQANAGESDGVLIKYDVSGNEAWARQFGTPQVDTLQSVSVDSIGNIYVAGATRGGINGNINAGDYDAYIIKYDTTGDTLWTQQFGADGNDLVTGVDIDPADNVYITGRSYLGLDGIPLSGDEGSFLTKYGPSGDELWSLGLGFLENISSASVSSDTLGNVFISGQYTKPQGFPDAFVAKFDSSGSHAWTQTLGMGDWTHGNAVAADGHGNAYLAGNTLNLSGGQAQEAFLSKFDTSGAELWTQVFGTDQTEYGASVATGNGEGVWVGGITFGSLDGNNSSHTQDGYVVRFDPIPEPSSASLLAIGLLMIAKRYTH